MYAPIIIPTLCRSEHLRRCIESLARNEKYARETELVIGLDYPPAKKYRKGWQEIKDYLPTITGFGKITIFEHKENIGARPNGDFLRRYIFEEAGYREYIYTEDDNEFSPNFLEYVNKGLERYRDVPNVYSVCGYNYPIDMAGYSNNVYCSEHFSAWGAGRWLDKPIPRDVDVIKKLVSQPGNYRKLLLHQPGLLASLYRMIRAGQVHGDVCIEIFSFLNGWVSVFPTVSKVRNWGYDGSGEHCGRSKQFCLQQIDQSSSFEFDEVPLRPVTLPSLNRFFRGRLTQRIHRFVDALLCKTIL